MALTLSAIALAVSIVWNWVAHQRAEKHRVQALKESDLLRLEEYWRHMKDELRKLNNRRAELCTPMRDIEAGKSVDWSNYKSGSIPSPSRLWPIIPGDDTKLAIAAFEAVGDVWTHVGCFEDSIKRRAPAHVVADDHKGAQQAIKKASDTMTALQMAIAHGRAKLRK